MAEEPKKEGYSLMEKLVLGGISVVITGGICTCFYKIGTIEPKPIFSGSIGMPEVERVEIFDHVTGSVKYGYSPEGITINVHPTAGGLISVRDYKADFQIDGKDTVETSTDAPQMDIGEVVRRAGPVVMSSNYRSHYGSRGD